MSEIFNALLHYANVRKNVVSDIPQDIDLTLYHLEIDEEDKITKSIPKVREFITSIYDSFLEYANTTYVTEKYVEALNKKGGYMAVSNAVRHYMDDVFEMLIGVLKLGVYEEDRVLVTKQKLRQIKFKEAYTKHYSSVIYMEYYKSGRESSYKTCDEAHFCFDDTDVMFTLKCMMKTEVIAKFFQYGDFRTFSKTGREEAQDCFPQSVHLKALGKEKYSLYLQLKERIFKSFHVVQSGQNSYQGHGHFQIIEDFTVKLENTQIAINTKQNFLLAVLHLDFLTFEKLPEVIAELTPNVGKTIFSTPSCSDCVYNCKRRRTAVFEENIYPLKVLRVCKWPSIDCVVENSEDVKSIETLYQHILKYTKKKG